MSERILERSLKFLILLLALILLAILVIPFTAEAQIVIKRSIRPGNTSVIHDLSTNAITISGSTLTATNPFPDSIGVGDAVQYDSSNSGAVTSIAFLHSRTSSTVWTVKRANGAAPSPCTSDTDGDIFGAYTSLANYIAGTENTGISATVRAFDSWNTSLITTTQERHAICYPGTDATTVEINWISNSTYQLKIYTPYLTSDVGTTQRHAGIFTGRCYFLSTSNATGSITSTSASGNQYYWTFSGLQIKNTVGDGLHDGHGSAGTASNIFVDSCIFIGSDNSSSSASHTGIDISSTKSVTYYIRNCIFYQWNSSAASNNNTGVHINGSSAGAYIYNCTAWDNDRCYVQIAGTGVCKNSIGASGTTASPTTWQGSWNAASDYNVDSRSLAPGANSTKAVVVAFVDSTNKNFHLKSTDTQAKNTGTNLSADANLPFTDDIDGGTRPDISTWDRGADEEGVSYGVVAGTSPTLLRRRNPVQ